MESLIKNRYPWEVYGRGRELTLEGCSLTSLLQCAVYVPLFSRRVSN